MRCCFTSKGNSCVSRGAFEDARTIHHAHYLLSQAVENEEQSGIGKPHVDGRHSNQSCQAEAGKIAATPCLPSRVKFRHETTSNDKKEEEKRQRVKGRKRTAMGHEENGEEVR